VPVAKNLSPGEIYVFLTSDFQDSWNSIAWNPFPKGRGNFMFAGLAFGFLEFACRLCHSDPTGKALHDFSNKLRAVDKKYFLVIPGLDVPHPGGFKLPYTNSKHMNDVLICALFDLVRNGLAHQYQQILVRLKGGRSLGVTLTGPAVGKYLEVIARSPRKKSNHLKVTRDKNGDVWMIVNTARAFLDFKRAFDEAKLLGRNLSVNPLTRPDPTRPRIKYDFTSITLESLFSRSVKRGFRK
jgi:hypothetical protein